MHSCGKTGQNLDPHVLVDCAQHTYQPCLAVFREAECHSKLVQEGWCFRQHKDDGEEDQQPGPKDTTHVSQCHAYQNGQYGGIEDVVNSLAGVIHTDFEKGFIRAEIISYEDFIAHNGEQGAKDAGRWRLEGKDYVVQDGDVIHFRFNV